MLSIASQTQLHVLIAPQGYDANLAPGSLNAQSAHANPFAYLKHGDWGAAGLYAELSTRHEKGYCERAIFHEMVSYVA